MDTYERLNRIREALQIRNMKQVDLCEKTGIKKSSLNSWITQRWQPKQDAIMKMARALDVSEMWLAGYDVSMDRPVEQKKSDELVKLIHSIRLDEDLKNLLLSICSLNSEQRKIIEGVVNELSKVNSLH